MKKKNLFALLTISCLIPSVMLPTVLLTSCSNISFSYSYNSDNQTIVLDSSVLGYNDIYYGVQAILSNDPQYNKWNLISDILINNIPSLFNEEIIISNPILENFALLLDVTNNNSVKKIVINFPKLSFNTLTPPVSNTYYVQANTVFLNNSLDDIKNLSSSDILNRIHEYGNVNLPDSCYISSQMSVSTNDYIDYYIFLPDNKIPYGLLKIYQQDVIVPKVEPWGPINEFEGNNTWENIINWYTPSIEGTTYKYIENIITNYNSSNNIISTYTSAKNSEIVDKYFSTFYNDIYLNLLNDLNYALKNSLSSLFSSWKLSNILDMNVFVGNDIVINNNKISGNYVIQFINPSEIILELNKENIYWNININNIKVPPKGIITLKFNFNNSCLYPYLSLQSDINNTAYLTSAFSNFSLELYLNDEKIYILNLDSEPYNLFSNSYTLKTIVKNVKDGNTILDANNQLFSSYTELDTYQIKLINENYINNNIFKFKTILKSVQNILLLSAQNPTIFEFLTSLNNDIYNLVLSFTNNEALSLFIGNLFSNQKLSVFLYYNLDNLIKIFETLLPNSEARNSLLSMLYDIQKNITSPTDMEQWVANLLSLKPMIEKVLSNQLGWLLDIIGPLLENLSQDPNLFECLLTMLPDIFSTLSTQTNSIGAIGNSLILYFNNLINFANSYDPDCKNDQIQINQYKNIRVLDFIVNEFTEGNENSLLNILITIVGSNNSTINTISNIINAINFKMDCKIRISFKNQIFQTYNYEIMNLYDVIKWIINSFFLDVKLEDGSTTDLYTAICDNIQYSLIYNNFKIDFNNNFVNQSCEWLFSLKQKIIINTLPLAALISKENVNLDLSSLNLSPIVSNLINTLLNNAIPVNLVISTKNVIQANFEANNSRLVPNVDSNGDVNWQYMTNNSLYIDVSNIISESNVRNSTQEKCYGSSYTLLKTLLPGFVSTKTYTNKIVWMSTNLDKPIKINNYNNSSYISELQLNLLVDDTTLIESFTEWVSNVDNYFLVDNKYVINYDSLNTFVSEYFKFSDMFNEQNFAKYQATITSANYKLISNTNSFTFNIVFPCPVLIVKPDNSCYLSNSFTLTINK